MWVGCEGFGVGGSAEGSSQAARVLGRFLRGALRGVSRMFQRFVGKFRRVSSKVWTGSRGGTVVMDSPSTKTIKFVLSGLESPMHMKTSCATSSASFSKCLLNIDSL